MSDVSVVSEKERKNRVEGGRIAFMKLFCHPQNNSMPLAKWPEPVEPWQPMPPRTRPLFGFILVNAIPSKANVILQNDHKAQAERVG